MTKKLNLANLSKNELTQKEMKVTGGLGICRCYCYCDCFEMSSYTNKSSESRMSYKLTYLDSTLIWK